MKNAKSMHIEECRSMFFFFFLILSIFKKYLKSVFNGLSSAFVFINRSVDQRQKTDRIGSTEQAVIDSKRSEVSLGLSNCPDVRLLYVLCRHLLTGNG